MNIKRNLYILSILLAYSAVFATEAVFATKWDNGVYNMSQGWNSELYLTATQATQQMLSHVTFPLEENPYAYNHLLPKAEQAFVRVGWFLVPLDSSDESSNQGSSTSIESLSPQSSPKKIRRQTMYLPPVSHAPILVNQGLYEYEGQLPRCDTYVGVEDIIPAPNTTSPRKIDKVRLRIGTESNGLTEVTLVERNRQSISRPARRVQIRGDSRDGVTSQVFIVSDDNIPSLSAIAADNMSRTPSPTSPSLWKRLKKWKLFHKRSVLPAE